MIKKLIDYQARKLFRNIQKSLVCFLKICFKLYNADLNYPDKTDKTLKLKFVFLKIGYFWKKNLMMTNLAYNFSRNEMVQFIL